MSMPDYIYVRKEEDGKFEISCEYDFYAQEYALSTGFNKSDDAITALCARIQAAAINCDTYHVFVQYAPHVDSLSVIVRDKDHDYDAEVDSWPDPIIDGHIYLNRHDSLEQLTKGIDQLQRLGIDV